MASKSIIYIHDLPFQPRRELCRILDADRRWEELGGNYMGHDVTTLTLIEKAVKRDKSPTGELLNKYSERNGTIKRLFIMLKKMDHQRAMSVLKPYVDEKYHCYLRTDGIMSTAMINSKKIDGARYTSSQLSMSTTCSTFSTSAQNHFSRDIGPSHKHKEALSTSSKLNQNFVNLNKEFSQVSLHSKMNGLSTPQSKSKPVPIKNTESVSSGESRSASQSSPTPVASEEKENSSNARASSDGLAPLPLLTVLRLQVSEFDGYSEVSSAQPSETSTNSYVSDD